MSKTFVFLFFFFQYKLIIYFAMPSIGQTWVLGYIDAVVEMGVLSYIETTAYGV
jgi:hypothetical protein